MTVAITSFGGLTVNGVSNYGLDMPDRPIAAFAASRSYRDRAGRSPVLDSVKGDPRVIPVRFSNQNTAAVTDAAFTALAGKTFDPLHAGTKTLLATHPDGSTALTIECAVKSAKPNEDSPWQVWDVELEVADWRWYRTTSVVTGSASSGSVTLTGDAEAFPRVKLTPSANGVNHRQVSVQDRTGRGLTNHWIRLAFNVSGTGASASSNYYVWFKGRLIPHYWHLKGDGVTAALDVRVDVPANDTVYLDVFYHSELNNTITADKLDEAQLDWLSTLNASAPNLDNNTAVWNNYTLTSAPEGADFSWFATKVGQTIDGVSYGLKIEGNTYCQFGLKSDGTLNGDADGMVTVLGCEAASSSAFTNLRRILTITKGGTGTNCVQTLTMPSQGAARLVHFEALAPDGVTVYRGPTFDLNVQPSSSTVQAYLQAMFGTGNVTVTGPSTNVYTCTFGGSLANTPVNQINVVEDTTSGLTGVTWATTTAGSPVSVRAFVRYRLPYQLNWTDAWTSTSAVDTSAAIDIPGAVEIAVGLEAVDNSIPIDATLELRNGAGGSLQCEQNTSLAPLVTIGSADTWYELNGTLTVGSNTATFTRCFMSGTTLTIDTDAQTWSVAANVFYGEVAFSNGDLWLPLEVGSNAFSTSFTRDGSSAVTVGVVFDYYPRYVV